MVDGNDIMFVVTSEEVDDLKMDLLKDKFIYLNGITIVVANLAMIEWDA